MCAICLVRVSSPSFFVMKIAQREEWSPSTDVVTNSVNKHERQSEMVLEFSRNCVHHSSGMGDGVEPEVVRHLIFCELPLGHVNHYFPMGFNQTIGRLALGRGSNNFRLVVNQVFRNSGPK
jgi:hypothetical protein